MQHSSLSVHESNQLILVMFFCCCFLITWDVLSPLVSTLAMWVTCVRLAARHILISPSISSLIAPPPLFSFFPWPFCSLKTDLVSPVPAPQSLLLPPLEDSSASAGEASPARRPPPGFHRLLPTSPGKTMEGHVVRLLLCISAAAGGECARWYLVFLNA